MPSVQLALIVLLLPLASATIIALFLRRLGTLASLVSTLACAGLAAAAFVLVFKGHRFSNSVEWLKLDTFTVSLGIKFDDLAALMLLIVAIVGLCVHLFSLGYMHEDEAKARYFGGLSIFMFSMLGIVFADNLFMMFIFWELVGFSSYLLINHYLGRQAAADAAKKAFIVNRVGDFGFLLGIIACYYFFGSVNLTVIAQKAHIGLAVPYWIPLLLFCGAVGKSAQMPLQVWLPDAMEGPTPVSALIHAATMVAAGIYMLCRIEPLFASAPLISLNVVMWVGTATALYAALCAITQSDIKKVLAYSTLSQLGYMVAAFGLGSLSVKEGGESHLIAAGVGAAMFHLTTHAFFKALMFLGSGSIIYGCHHEQDIFKMGGLRKKMPFTFITFTIGVLAIIGAPWIAAGFYSKDAILYLAFEKNATVFAILAGTAVLTALYMVRLWQIVFFGAPRSEEASHAHEGGLAMILPLGILAILSILGGRTALYGHHFDQVWSLIPEAPDGEHTIFFVSVGVMLAGLGFSIVFYRPAGVDRLQKEVPPLFAVLSALKESFDQAYNYYVAKIQQRFALFVNFLEQIVLAGIIVRGFSGVVGLIGMGARALHVGSLHAYVYWFLIGTVLVWGFASGFFY